MRAFLELTRSAGIQLNKSFIAVSHPAGTINHVRTISPMSGTNPRQSRQAIIPAWRLLFWDEPNKHGRSELCVSLDWDHLDTMRTAKRREAPTTNFDTSGRAKELKAVLCLSEIKLAHTDDEARQEMALAKCDQRHVLFAATARPC
jgi:hypothetical protein